MHGFGFMVMMMMMMMMMMMITLIVVATFLGGRCWERRQKRVVKETSRWLASIEDKVWRTARGERTFIYEDCEHIAGRLLSEQMFCRDCLKRGREQAQKDKSSQG